MVINLRHESVLADTRILNVICDSPQVEYKVEARDVE